ncbi:MAG: hypothetical protein ACYTF5_05990 [Planctomycetota bacterium]|jgi:hypothetical protein
MDLIRTLPLAVLLSSATVCGQANARAPHIGYLFPGGGQQGTTFVVRAGGQYLSEAAKVYVSGEGVRATIIKHTRPIRNLNGDQRRLLEKRLKEITEKRLADLRARRDAASGKTAKKAGSEAAREARKEAARKEAARKKAAAKKKGRRKKGEKEKPTPPPPPPMLPNDPLFYALDRKSPSELSHIVATLEQVRGRQQINRQLGEALLIRVVIDEDAQPGERELRIGTKGGLTNPMIFDVGGFREVRELEPNDDRTRELIRYNSLLRGAPALRRPARVKPHAVPVVLNGQILPGDIDRFRFLAQKGQTLVIEARARRLIPYLADAVPGWFQATLALYDAQGDEVSYVDGYRFHPDPVIFCRVPRDGEYMLEIRDAIYRGRDDFIYRIIVGEQPFITAMFPLGGKAGVATEATVTGWNFPETQLPLNTKSDDTGLRKTYLEHKGNVSNTVVYAVDSLPECRDIESNNNANSAQDIRLPVIINGRIGWPGDVDVFRIGGAAGWKVVAEVYGRRLDSPLDSLLRITDSSGRQVAWNDDHVMKEGHLHKDPVGLMTHHADAYVMFELPRDGTCYVHLSDTQRQGSGAHAYRLRITRPMPDFELRMTPSSISMKGSGMAPIDIHVLRKDGFNGPIRVSLKKSLGFELIGGRIPAGCTHMRMSLKAPNRVKGSPVVLELEGRGRSTRRTIRRRVVPAEDQMQAFLYRHLVPSQELRVAVIPTSSQASKITVTTRQPIRVPAGGAARVRIKGLQRLDPREVDLVLNDPPRGLSIGKVSVDSTSVTFQLKAAKGKKGEPPGFTGSLVVEVYRVYTPKGRDGKPTGPERRVLVGVMPAIAIKIVRKRGG